MCWLCAAVAVTPAVKRLLIADPRNMPAMPDDTVQNPPEQPPSAPLISDPELQQAENHHDPDEDDGQAGALAPVG
jgi:hypothetical protein